MKDKWFVIKEANAKRVHVACDSAYTDHEDSPTCWCRPYLSYRCPWNNGEVWTHNRCEA